MERGCKSQNDMGGICTIILVMSFLKNPHYVRHLNSMRKLAFYAQGLSQKLISSSTSQNDEFLRQFAAKIVYRFCQDNSGIYTHSLVAFRHRSDERNPPDVTASLIGHIPLLRSVIEVTSESPSP